MDYTKKTTRDGTEYIVVETTDGKEYYFTRKSDGSYSPSTIGATDEDGLTKACDYLTNNGMDIKVTGLSPSGFEY